MKFLKENKNNTLKAKIIYINMYWTLISLLSLISTAFSNPIKVQEDPNAKFVTKYDSGSFSSAVEKQEYILMDFYATWC